MTVHLKAQHRLHPICLMNAARERVIFQRAVRFISTVSYLPPPRTLKRYFDICIVNPRSSACNSLALTRVATELAIVSFITVTQTVSFYLSFFFFIFIVFFPRN